LVLGLFFFFVFSLLMSRRNVEYVPLLDLASQVYHVLIAPLAPHPPQDNGDNGDEEVSTQPALRWGPVRPLGSHLIFPGQERVRLSPLSLCVHVIV
jgi:hypothetical protein